MITGALGVLVKLHNRFERIFVEILAQQLKFASHIGRRGYDAAADRVSLEDIGELARTGPEQFGLGERAAEVGWSAIRARARYACGLSR